MADELTPHSFALFLKDKAFVEYFNSFLLLPVFCSCQLMYDSLSGQFITLELPQEELTTSQTSFLITDSDINTAVVLDHGKLWQWIVENRLPLFVHSDLYSEYILSKILRKTLLGYTQLTKGRGQVSAKRRKHVNISKSEMTKFKSFLHKYKRGLRNWLYCIDLFQMNNHKESHDKERLCLEIKERYFNATSSLALSNDVIGCGPVTMTTILQVGDIMLRGLTNYWYPRYLDTRTYTSHSLPSLTHPSSVNTPTFKRIKTSSKTRCHSMPITTPTIMTTPVGLTTPTRCLWSRDSHVKRAKYSQYHLIANNGKISSRPLSTGLINNNNDDDDEDPLVISVSGTPLITDTCKDVFMKCLEVERRRCGGYFQTFLQSFDDKCFLNCLLFWREVHDYKQLFFGIQFNPLIVEIKSKCIYSQYVLDCGSYSIKCPRVLEHRVTERAWPPYEDLFDEIEDYVIEILKDKWIELSQKDKESFQQIPLASSGDLMISRELDKLSEEYASSTDDMTDSVCSLTTLTPTRPLTTPTQPLTTISSTHQPSTVHVAPASNERELNLTDIMNNSKEFEYFKIFLTQHTGGVFDLMCWLDIEAYRALPYTDSVLKNRRASQLREKFFNKKYLYGEHSPIPIEIQRELASRQKGARPQSPVHVFREAQKYIKSRLEKKWIRLFVKSDEYIQRQIGIKDDTTKEANSSFAVQQISESLETTQLKNCLYNNTEKNYFKEFIDLQAPKGTRPSNNVEFWLEIQRYKNMFHYQMNHVLMNDKMKAIINCYINSICTPKLQVNVPVSVADELVKKTFGPYVFREAQNCVFRYLQSSWQDYYSFRTAHDDMRTALHVLQESVLKERREAEERIIMNKLKEAAQRETLLQFETEQERKLRKQKEPSSLVGVAFKLSAITPTELPLPDHTHKPHTHVRFQSPVLSAKVRQTDHFVTMATSN